MKISLLLFTLTAGATLDHFVSMKIFIFYSLYSAMIKGQKDENNNFRS
jgi:hypothetical protein